MVLELRISQALTGLVTGCQAPLGYWVDEGENTGLGLSAFGIEEWTVGYNSIFLMKRYQPFYEFIAERLS